jgi:hypothetical protein
MLREKNWCCQTGLNCRPLHYQWSALPLSYGSMPVSGIGPKGPHRRAVLATRTPLAQARGGARNDPKWAKNGVSHPWQGRSGSLSAQSTRLRAVGARIVAADRAFAGAGGGTTGRRNPLWSAGSGAGRSHRPGRSEQTRFRQARMKDNQAKPEGKASREVRDPRRDRLKAALRENLKRRKSQARGRDDLGAASSEPADASLDDAGGETPGQ